MNRISQKRENKLNYMKTIEIALKLLGLVIAVTLQELFWDCLESNKDV